VGVTGSIAIYKTLDLIRLYIKSGAEVKVILTSSAQRFVTALTFEALIQNEVLTEDTESWANENNHIDIGKWADLFVIAPATANTINKLSNGIADNLLTQSTLAYKGIKLIAPAANTNMYKNPLTTASLKMLKLINYEIVEPIDKMLACGDEGAGALAEVNDIFYASARVLIKDEFWSDRKVVISGGGTIEKIDDVRFISNFSSGKMAKELAKALYLKGADVCLISTKKFRDLPKAIYTIDVESSQELYEYLVDAIRVSKKGIITQATLMQNTAPELIQKKPYLFMVSAVSDYKPKHPQSGKMKKEIIGDVWNLELEKNIDILDELDKDGIFAVGFKAEMDEKNGEQNAKVMLENKQLDAVCLNYVSDNAFGSDENEITLFTKTETVKFEKASKFDISMELLSELGK
jgi:phosphopantothenoylcysteine decarboxylase/phosphopantothenate--cysteine ligase